MLITSRGEKTTSGAHGTQPNGNRNLPMNVRNLDTLSLSSRALGAVLILGYLLAWSDFTRRVLGLTPGLAVPFRVWTFVTYAYLPASLTSLLATAPLATYLTHVLDPIQGQRGLALIVLVTVVAAGVATWLTTVVGYVISSILSRTAGEAMIGVLYTPICGFYAGIVGLLVGLKQAMPGEVTIRDIKVNTGTLPVAYVAIISLAQIIWGRMINCLILVYGLIAAWVWLRYFHPGVAGLVGDPSDQFALLSFLPESMQRHAGLKSLSDKCDERMQVWAAHAKDIRGVLAAIQRGRLGVVDASAPGEASSDDAARRRERGMKSLEERLGAGSGGGGEVEEAV